MGKKWRKLGKRFGAWILSAVMAVSLVTVPEQKAEAADFGTTRDYSSGVTATLSNQSDSPSSDWSGFDMTIINNSGSTICDWIVVLSVPSGMASAFKCWNATFVADGDTIYLYPMQDGSNAVVSTGTMSSYVPGGGFASQYVDASSITVKAVYYNIGTTSSYDYSSGETNDDSSSGSSGSDSSSVTETPTDTDLDVEYNYAKLLQESLYFYDANMCGEIEGTCALSWRGNCHTYDATAITYTSSSGTTYNVDVSGGFHDAGDHVKFGLPQGYAATMLGMSYYQFQEAFDELGQTEHLKTITNWFCDYFKRCTVYEDGAVIAFCYQVGNGSTDHAVWSSPESQTMDRSAYFADASNPATDEVSVAIAALAMNYINFGDEKDLTYAKDLYTFVTNNDKACATSGASGFYDSTSWGDDYALAASALYAATGDTTYNGVYNTYKDNSSNGVNQYWVLDWANTGALSCMLQRDTSALASITNVCKNKSTIDGVFNCVDSWGSCRYSAAEQFAGLVYDKLTGLETYEDWATGQMNYMIGDNPKKRCYIVGYNENSSKYPHHRAASNSTGAATTSEDHYTLLGALVGGPGSNGTYQDDQNNYNCNEVALDYNAGLVGAAAGLYLAHEDDDTVALSYAGGTATNSKTLATSDELSAVGVKKYYGTASSDTDDAHTHSYTKSVTKAASCTENGVYTYTCSCGDTYTESIPATGHTAVTDAAVAATCTTTGLTAGSHCSACSATITAQTEVAATGHTYKSTVTKAATTTEEGVRTYTCTVCGDTYTEAISKLQNSADSGDDSNTGSSGNTNSDNADDSDSTGSGDSSNSAGSGNSSNNGNSGSTGSGNESASGEATSDTAESAQQASVIVTKITITSSTKKVAPGKKLTLTAQVYPETATNQNVTWKLTGKNKKYATISSEGVLKVKKSAQGKTITVAAVSADTGKVKATYRVKVMKKAVKKIKLTAKKTTLKKNQSVMLKATFTPKKGISKEVTWTSSNPKVATVNAKGVVVAKKRGKVKITAKAKDESGKRATITIKVR